MVIIVCGSNTVHPPARLLKNTAHQVCSLSLPDVEGKQAEADTCAVCNTYFREPVYL